MSTSRDVVPCVGAASWESRVCVAVVETRNVMVAVVHKRDEGHEQSYHSVTDMWDPYAWVPPVSEGKAGQGSDSHVRGSMCTSGDVVPWVGVASWELRVGVVVVETRNVMVVVVQLPWTSCHVC